MKETSAAELDKLLKYPEGVHMELKEARGQFSQRDLLDYCAALANEGGGKLILGVKNNGEVVGSKAYEGAHQKLGNVLLDELGIRVDVEELIHSKGRVVIFHVPPHGVGHPVRSKGKYLMRAGESLKPMDRQTLQRKLSETQPDFTAGVVPGLTMSDLDPDAMKVLREKWVEKSGRKEFRAFNDEKTLRNLDILDGNGISSAALILVGRAEVIRDKLADAEIIYEWRNDPKQTHHDFRVEWRKPFVLIDDEIWQTVNARNIRIPFQDGFMQREVWAFDEKSVREAVHNAVMHRDYSVRGSSVFIKATPCSFDIESPGGLVPGITLENILFEHKWRNRRLAEAFGKIGFAERSSQGMDDIFERAIRDGKGCPDLSGTTSHAVRLSIPALVKDKDFILYLERVMNERQVSLSFEEIFELERIREGKKVGRSDFKDKFIELGIVEAVGKGRGVKYLLSRRYYETIGQSGKHTRLKGLSRDQIKELILTHIREGKPSRREDFLSGFPECHPGDISNMLQELKRAGRIKHSGSRKTGRWAVS